MTASHYRNAERVGHERVPYHRWVLYRLRLLNNPSLVDEELNVSWRTAREHTRFTVLNGLSVGFLGLAIFALSTLPIYAIDFLNLLISLFRGQNYESGITYPGSFGWLLASIPALLLLLASLGFRIAARRVMRRWLDERFLAERKAETAVAAFTLQRVVEEADDSNRFDPAAFVVYWKNTQDRLDSFHREANLQVKTAYRLSQVASVLGLIVILILGFSAANAEDAPQSFVAGGVAAVAGALSAYIGRTFQTMYSRALHQTMTYFSQPVVASRLLSGERIANTIEDGAVRDKALLEIVRSAASVPPEIADRQDSDCDSDA